MNIVYRWFVKIWGMGGPSHGAYYYDVLKATKYEDALKEVEERAIGHDGIYVLATDEATGRILSRGELERINR